MSEVGAHLVAGDAESARALLSALRLPLRRVGGADFLHRSVQAAAAVADILGGGEPQPGDRLGAADPAVLPLALISRTAFEQGDFRTVIRLSEISGGLGLATVPVVAAAALIEEGRTGEARALLPSGPSAPGKLARRVAQHLRNGRENRGVLLRDREGRPIGTVDGEVLRLSGEVAPELVPRVVAQLIPERRAGSAPERETPGGGPGSLRLSLDLELSAAAYDAFGRRYRGSIVLVDARTGGILAAVSDHRTFASGGTAAFEQLREPASIAKLVTTAAARRAGLDPDAELGRMRCRGQQLYGGKVLYCPHVAGPLRGLERALAVSCNVAFANLGVRVGWRGMLAELLRFGFEAPAGPFPGGRILRAYGDDRRLADLAIGLEVIEITPLHAALVAAVVANRGVMPVPSLVTTEDGRLGLHPRPLEIAAGRRVIDRAWVPEILGAMEAVVRRGTASRFASARFPVAMKTGTASDPRHGFHVNYIGVGPMPDPWLAFCIRITDQPTSRKVRAAAREVTWRLLESLGRIAAARGWIDAFRESVPERLATVEDPAVRRRLGRPAPGFAAR